MQSRSVSLGAADSSEGMITGIWDSASFRDEKARLYRRDGRIYRVLSPTGLSNWRAFIAHPLAAELMAANIVIGTRENVEGLAGVTSDPVLEHERVPFVSYAYEWPFSMLKRAALLHLDLLEQLIPQGFILQDATPNNVLFSGTHPVFIDLPSIVPYRSGDIWQGLGQFLRTMFYPLILTAHKGIPYQAWLRSLAREGLPPWQIGRLFGWPDLLRPGVLRFVKLAVMLEKAASSSLTVRREEIRAAGLPSKSVLRTVKRLRHDVLSLNRKPVRTPWVGYAEVAPYTGAERQRKHQALRSALERLRPHVHMIWDIGCNTGEYSFVASDFADVVVAMDEDEAVTDALYTRCEQQGVENVLCLVVDIMNPSPAQGWAGAEYLALTQRGTPDLIILFALMHHLVLINGILPELLLEGLHRWCRYCLIEHITRDDPMARILQENVGEGHHELPTAPVFEELARRYFDILEVTPINCTRTVYFVRSKAGCR